MELRGLFIFSSGQKIEFDGRSGPRADGIDWAANRVRRLGGQATCTDAGNFNLVGLPWKIAASHEYYALDEVL